MTSFDSLNLSAPVLKAVKAEGYETPTPIQAQAIPHLLAGRDLLGIAQTGTGKTAAFALPILDILSRENRRPERGTCRALILAPTRELCSQILESFKAYGKNLKLSRTVVFGGVGIGRQIDAVRAGVDILVATPGRLVDLIERRALTLSKVEIFVLDEVDQMLDLGFIHAIRKITGLLPKQRQNLFFSATMPKEIAGLAANLLQNPARVEITPVATTAERVTQSVIHVDPANKAKLLTAILQNPQVTRALVFTRTKHGADKVVKFLLKDGVESAAIHGNKSQNNRERALAGFKAGKVVALVATDIAARGIDVDGVSHVFNYDLPFVPESYVHRIGRTARAGAQGEAIAFCTPEERGLLRDIERTIRQNVPITEHELGIKGITELVPAGGWNPMGADRRPGGGRQQQKPARKPHRGRGGPRSDGPTEGRFEARGEQRPERSHERRSEHRHEHRSEQGGEQRNVQRAEHAPAREHAAAPARDRAPAQPRAHAPASKPARSHEQRAAHHDGGRSEGRPTGGAPRKASKFKGPRSNGGQGSPGGKRPAHAGQGAGHAASRGGGNSGNWMKSIGRGNTP